MDSKAAQYWLGIEDFFNYYLPGLVWLVNILFLTALIDTDGFLYFINFLGQISTLVLIGLGVLIPYLSGIMFNSFGIVVRWVDGILLGKPEIYVLDPAKKKRIGRATLGKSLGKELRVNVEELSSKRLNTKSSSASFFPNVRYSLQFAPFPRVTSHIARLTNLINLHEGLIIPMALNAILLLLTPSSVIAISKILGVLVLLATFSVWEKYHYLRETRVKQVFRYFFLWVTLKKQFGSEEEKE